MDMIEALRKGAAQGQMLIREGPGPAMAYAQALARSGGYAAALDRLGVRPGDRVAVQAEKSPEVLLLYLGCLRLGAVFLPLNTAYTPAETAYFLQDAEPALFVSATVRSTGSSPVPHMSPDRLAQEAGEAEFDDLSRAPDDLAAILYTSGTTGRSKGVMLTRGNLSSNAAALARTWCFTPDDVLLHPLPVFHTHGLFVATNTVLAAGASMVFLTDASTDAIFSVMQRCSVMMGVPTHYIRLLADRRLSPSSTSGMRLFICGSAPLSAATHRAFARATGHDILERYGMTETSIIASNPCAGERRAGTVGFPLPDVVVRVTDTATGRPLPQGDVGSIEVRGPNVFSGYWRAPDKTARDFREDGYFVTGDLGRFDPDGYLTIVGRSKDLVISGGLNVYPAEVEDAIDALPGVVASAVVGVAHPDLGEAVVAVVSISEGTAETEDSIRAALRPALAGFKLPKRIIFMAELPRNAMGKIQKAQLRATLAGLFLLPDPKPPD